MGDIVRVTKDEPFPCDLLLVSTSNDDGVCYIETVNLDGESNLKLKKVGGRSGPTARHAVASGARAIPPLPCCSQRLDNNNNNNPPPVRPTTLPCT